ncbi:MAG: formylglycine-generating enzyme family protein [Nitrosomonas sp.]|nr:formylglycine-generating enzyme family protein [Nitrosomonas sp.]
MINIRKHTVFPDEFPEAWASDWGEDEYGLWMAFTYKGVKQVFRWCEPGMFLMGSPEDEPERFIDEKLHEVTLTKGFWIADTPVIQALWHAVMGNNPSQFKGEEYPVENVSWNNVQEFITTMNSMKAELKLCLPTEAQWEYACRANTTTPFSWGNQIDSLLVNFDGNYPYKNGRKSEYRERTIEVKALPCNDWGIYQMHGNVLEWCLDWYGQYDAYSVIDPIGPNTGGNHILRGGSWFGPGKDCRSASRDRDGSRVNFYNIGFRLARSL